MEGRANMNRQRSVKGWTGLALIWLTAVAVCWYSQTADLSRAVQALLFALSGGIVLAPMVFALWRICATISFR
jgi:glucose-6-phosphate-specific signal transduction histidine kinase